MNGENQYWVVLNKCFDKEIDFKNKCPNLFKILSSRLKTNKNKWWEFPNVRNLDLIKNTDEKLFSPRNASFNSFCYNDNYHVMKGTNSIIISLKLSTKYVLALLNASLASYFYHMYGFSYHGNTVKKYEPGNIKII